MEKKKMLKECMILFWIFMLGSVIGYLYEMLVVLVQKGYFESRQGLIYGPFTPVYGIGAVIYYFVLNKINVANKAKVFLITAVLGGTTEYICSFVQEKAFGTISWDYSYLKFNLHGRTSLLHCTYWGIAGILYVIYVDSFIERLKEKIAQKGLQIMTGILAIGMVWNIQISCLAAERQEERRNQIPPENDFDVWLDESYPDERLDRIFANKKEVDAEI